MAISDAVQALSAAFSFGTLLQAATGALFIFYGLYRSTIFRDGRRLVLMLFVLFSALWTQVEFLNLLLPDTRATVCQGIVLISTVFDQLARFGIEQFLLWSVGNVTKLTADRLILQGMLFLRLVAGGLLVGFTRPHPGPVCVARRAVAPIGIVVLVLDGFIVGMLLLRVTLLGNSGNLVQKSADMKWQQRKASIWTVIGLGIWTGTSVPLILGIPTTILMLRTVLPSNGLLVLIGIVTRFLEPLLLAREEGVTIPEASSPFINIMPPPRELFAENISSNGSPVANENYAKGGSLFVVNPSATPHHSPTVFQRGTRGDTRGFTKLGSEANAQEMDSSEESHIPGARGPGYRGSSGVFPAILQARQQEQASLPPHIRPAVLALPRALEKAPAATLTQKRSMFSRSKVSAPPKQGVRKLGISHPIPIPTDDTTSQSLAKIQTVGLATAANMERERREEASARSRLVADSPAPRPSQVSTQEALSRSISVKRKENPILVTEAMPDVPVLPNAGLLSVATDGTTSSASLSPGREELRRRSSKQARTFDEADDPKVSEPALQRQKTIGLPSNPRATRTIKAQEAAMAKAQAVMLMNDTVYDKPEIAGSFVEGAPAMHASAQKTRIVEISAFSARIMSLNSSGSIIHRPRGYKREKHDSDCIISAGEPPGHRRSKSGSSIQRRRPKFMSQPGSPTHLPPLPPPPILTPAQLRRLLPTGINSMSFDEKIEFLFPAPARAVANCRRRSSVPSIPCLPSSFMSESPTVQSPTVEVERSLTPCKTTATASLAAPEIPLRAMKRLSVLPSRPDSDAYRSSVNSYQALADGVGEKWVSGVPSRYLSPLPQSDLRGHEAIVPMMLDVEEEARRSVLLRANDIRGPILSIADESSTGDKNSSLINPSFGWHYRIGDVLSTFSERPVLVRRKMPPPTPLLLSRTGRKATVVVRHAEPSPPPDSPGKAIIAIQEQLKRLEERPSRGSVGSLLRRIPGNGEENIPDTGRTRLLDNLEKEMEQQECQWHRMQTNLDRDSMSVTMSPNAQAESRDVTRDLAQRPIRTPSMVSQGARMRSSKTARPKNEDSNRIVSTQSFDNTRASMWQRRLLEAQSVYMENAPALLRRKSLNFLSITQVPAPVTSPTPPDSAGSETEIETDNESDSDTEAMKQHRSPQTSRKEEAALWQPNAVSPEAALGSLWNPPPETAAAPAMAAEPPASSLRPTQRRAEHILPIFSTALWTKTSPPEHSQPVFGLWGSKAPKPVRPRSIKARSMTQRPQRKSRRISFLPDIVESPIPVPNRRKSLGIFQFPWGETSDQPVYQPTFVPNLFVGPVLQELNANLDAGSEQFEPVRSPSVLDDYEDEDEKLDYIESGDEFEDFDENTLFEIASMLNSSDVPSKASLLPAPRKQGMNDDDTDLEPQSPLGTATLTARRLSIEPLALTPRHTGKLWDSANSPDSQAVAAGLPQPEPAVWDSLSASDDAIRSKTRSLPTVSSEELGVATASMPNTARASYI
ncbi:hypothetical protein B2J93_3537 [Marssonina coronariae]|uniref:Uncharacterized protein n=1 Tax=Diplocarpon coronariae TaxID=2795749 RepID=A0A218Z4L1_9HELO|nr:hypothetical protein B2J93_3537 [Marssonina coronariae]